MKLKEIAENHGLTPEGVDYALTQYQIVICEITHGILSKLSYDAKDIIRTAQERWCDTCDLKEQEPRLLGLEEVKAIALREVERILSSEVEPVWLERNEGGLTNLELVLISWWYMEGIDKDETEFEFIVKFFGSDLDDTLNYLDYGTRWRVWSSKPTIEQRKVVKWDD